MSDTLPTVSVDDLVRAVWALPAEQLAAFQNALPPRLVAARLGELSDEILALAVQKEFFLVETFEELFARRYLRHYFPRWLRCWGASDADADDVAQILTIRCWETRLRAYEPSLSLRRYLYRAARNQWISGMRGRRPAHDLHEPASAEASPLANVIAGELLEQVRRHAGRLADDEGRILEEMLGGASSSEIADSLGLPVCEVYQRTFRLRRSLERFLHKE